MNHVGIDVDSKTLVCRIQRSSGSQRTATFPNQPAGYRRLAEWSLKHSDRARVCLEATGVYSLPVALYLSAEDQIEVMVVNPKAIKNFATAILQRGKTDKLDAHCILQYVLRMDFRLWSVPTEKAMEMQHVSRRIRQLNEMKVQEKNRLKAAQRLGDWGRLGAVDIEEHIAALKARIDQLQQRLLDLVEADEACTIQLKRLVSIVGVAERSGTRLLAELNMLPADLNSRQWVAHAGLDPRPNESGGSVHKPRRISRLGNSQLREVMYFPALVAIRHEPHVRAYYDALIERGKKPKQAIVAVMRKLLVAIWGMFKNEQNWDGEKFYQMT